MTTNRRNTAGSAKAIWRDPLPFKTPNVSEPASNTDAEVTYNAEQNKYHMISGIAWSYDADPTGGNLLVHDGNNHNFLSLDITTGGPGFIPFDPEMHGDKGQQLVITLSAGGAGISGKVNVLGHRTLD